LRLALLVPDIVEAILDGRPSKGLRLAQVLGNGPLDWDEQRSELVLRIAAILFAGEWPRTP
jgi:hypothetical protein